MGRLTHLDGLRGVAASLVLVGHLMESVQDRLPMAWLDGVLDYVGFGRIGVLAFFCISGFVIPFSFRGPQPLRGFVIGRFFRLYPAFWLSILLAVVVFGMPETQVLLANLTMLQGLLKIPDMIAVYWTLTIELIFYGLCAVLFVVGRLCGPRTTTAVALGLFGLAAGFSLLSHFGLLPLPPVGLLSYLGIMFFGTSCRLAFLEGDPFAKRAWPWVVTALAVSVAIVGLYGYGAEATAERPIADFIGIYVGLALFLAAFGMKEFLSRRAMVWLGNVSYSLYLLHPLCVAVVAMLAARIERPALSVSVILLGLPLSLVVAHFSNRLIEQPGIRLGRMLAHRSLNNAPAGAN